jgi:hypothetical protein
LVTNRSFRALRSSTRKRREKEKTFRALHQPQKVLVVELISFALPDAPGALRWRRVDGCTGPQRQVTYSPFRLGFYNSRRVSSISNADS